MKDFLINTLVVDSEDGPYSEWRPIVDISERYFAELLAPGLSDPSEEEFLEQIITIQQILFRYVLDGFLEARFNKQRVEIQIRIAEQTNTPESRL